MLTDSEIKAMAALRGRDGEKYIREASENGSGFILAWEAGKLTGFLEYAEKGEGICEVVGVTADDRQLLSVLKRLAGSAYPVIQRQTYDFYISSVSKTNPVAVLLYKKLGFSTAGESGSKYVMRIDRVRLLEIAEKYADNNRKDALRC